MTINSHILSWSPRITLLLRSGRSDPDLIAILMAESFFRPAWLRLCEYFWCHLLCLIDKKRAGYVSIGMAQVQLRHLGAKPPIDICFDPIVNYDILHRYHCGKGSLHLPLQGKIASHVGEVRGYYMKLILQSTQQIQRLTMRSTEHLPASRSVLGRYAPGTDRATGRCR